MWIPTGHVRNAGERTRTSTGVTPPEPKSGASANFATPAWIGAEVDMILAKLFP